jgi:hypothetical protein
MPGFKAAFAGIALFCMAASIPALAIDSGGPYLIGWGVNPQNVRPTFIRDHLAYMETKPYDGAGISSNAGWTLMDGPSISYTTMYNEFAPMAGLTYTKLKHNLAAVNINRPADFFDDWSVTIQNFATFAKMIKAIGGIEGILFDNEAYKLGVFNYPDDCKYASTKSLLEYQNQARLRGSQIMAAMIAEFPDIQVLFLHGPYVSWPNVPSYVLPNSWASGNELMGPFSVGFMQNEGSGGAMGRDGGELYQLRSATDFQNAYQWRKYDFGTDQLNVPWIPSAIRNSVWPKVCGVDFGVYNGGGQTSTSIKTTMINALTRCDRYTWFYVEGFDLFSPGGTPTHW